MNREYIETVASSGAMALGLSPRLSADILLEYQEFIIRQSGDARWRTLERLLDLAAAHGGNKRCGWKN